VEAQHPLRVGLQSQSPWVRFAAAESLAYLGNTAAAAELARLAEQHPALRTHCLLALATLDDGVSSDRLAELLNHPEPQLRYGAFTALRSANERHAAVGGKHVKKTFWLHQVAPDSQPLVHLASHSRAEIVLFGKVGELVAPFSFPVGKDFTVTAKAGDLSASVTRIIPDLDGPKEVTVQSNLSVAAVLNTMGEMGGGYSEAVELLRRAETAKVMVAAVMIDANPQGIPLVQLAQMAKTEVNLERANLEVERVNRGGEIVPANFDLPSNEEPKAAPAPEPKELSRNPGRLFSGKKHPMDSDEPSPLPPSVTAPSAPQATNRNPGRLFGK
jgi:hypothetical protein